MTPAARHPPSAVAMAAVTGAELQGSASRHLGEYLDGLDVEHGPPDEALVRKYMDLLG